MKNIFRAACLFLVLGFSAKAIAQQKGDFTFGGIIGINFGNNSYFGINVAPNVGYMFADNLETGIVGGYEYNIDDFARQNLFNVGGYSNFFFLNNLFLRGDYVYYTGNLESRVVSSLEQDIDEWALWLGGGFRQRIGGKISLLIGWQYNVLYEEDNSIFGSAWRPFTGVTVGF